jgi:hypothetical protein
MAKHRDIKSLMRAFQTTPTTSTAPIKLKAPAVSEDAVAKAVSTMVPKQAGQVKLPISERGPVDDGGHIWLRPSQLVARIADIEKPGFGYQRPPKSRLKKLKAIAKKFDKDLLGLFHVWINAEGDLELLDALGRCYVCLHLVVPAYDEPVLVKIHYDVKTVAQAAAKFLELNPDEVTKVTDRQKFMARLTAKEASALVTQSEAEAGGLIVGGTGRNGISVQAAEALSYMGVLTVCGLIKLNGAMNKDTLNGPQWIGLGAHVLATGDNSNDLRELTLADIVRRKDKMYGKDAPHARTTAARYARAVYDLRSAQNSNRLLKNRVVADWSKVDGLVAGSDSFPARWGKPGDRLDNPKRAQFTVVDDEAVA